MRQGFPFQLPPVAFTPAQVSAVLTFEHQPAPSKVFLSVARISGSVLLYQDRDELYQV